MIELQPKDVPPNAIRTMITLLWIIAPWFILILGSTVPDLQSGKDDGKCVHYRPDTWLYIFSWVFICLCLSVSWILLAKKSKNKDFTLQAMLFLLIIVATIMWLWRYHTRKIDGISIFVILLFFIVMLLPIAYKNSVYGFALLLPLLVWVIFQLIVSMRELEYTDDCKLIDKCTPAS
jgi:tryptophan-rich sensory protein